MRNSRLFLVCFIVLLTSFSCTKDQSVKDRFIEGAEARWFPHPISVNLTYYYLTPGFVLSRGYSSWFDYISWVGQQVDKTEFKSESESLESYLNATVRSPEQLILVPSPVNSKETSPDSQMQAKQRDRMTACADQYIQHCVKSGKYKEYLSFWESPDQVISYGNTWCTLYYSDISIVSLNIVSSESFFNQAPGSSLNDFFSVEFFPSTVFLFDMAGNAVEDGPVGGVWYYDNCVRADNMNNPWSIDKLLSYKPRILPFGLKMTKRPPEHPGSADFTVRIGYSDGSEYTSTLSVSFPY